MKTLALALALAAALPAAAQSRREALDFLYRHMPHPDRAMHDSAFWGANVDASLRARAEMPWGAQVPMREWLHFVLPVRVNNEDLDLSRPLFYEELKERVKGKTMPEAILEVNHWCHEKVTYRASDARTSSPLSSVSQAIGRCGEESTFAVAALRSVGIPARQVYTPRWAHTDDNHAWVEAWADGRWHFLGACEPEPILDLAWFNVPASRGMMMHTNVFGDYRGPEQVMDRNDHYTTINVTGNYAPTAGTAVTVLDSLGHPVPGATVAFCIYNYAEYYPMARLRADASGTARLLTGRGDMVVWATDGKRFGLQKATAGDSLSVSLAYTPASRATLDFDLTPPPASASLPRATPDQAQDNRRRLAAEDSIRNAYTATFATSDQAGRLAKKLGLPAKDVEKALVESRGNHAMLAAWLDSVPRAERRRALDLLLGISEKDRRDVSRAVLDDNLRNTPARTAPLDADLYNKYVLNPRVENEGLTPCKAFFLGAFTPEERAEYREHPQKWVEAVRKHVAERRDGNPKLLRMSPEAVWREGSADALSTSICLVSGLRAFGVPARIDPVTGKTQYASARGAWIDVADSRAAEKADAPGRASARLAVSTVETPLVAEPRYYYHYSLSQVGADLLPRQMEWPEGITVQEWLRQGVRLDPGQYMLTTGQRLADGGVLARSELFAVAPNDTAVSLPFVMRHDDRELQVIGSLDAETQYLPLADCSSQPTSLLSTAGRGYYVVALVADGSEPSAHLLTDLQAVAEQYAARPEHVILLYPAGQQPRTLPGASLQAGNIHFGVDLGGRVAEQLRTSLNLPQPLQLPVVAIADSFGRVVFASTGYAINLPDTLLTLLRKLGK